MIALGTNARNGIPRPSRVVAHWLMPVSAAIAADFADDRLAGDRALAEQDPRRGSCGQIDVDPAAEADQADALAGLDHVAFLDEGHDPPRDQARRSG